MKNLAKRLDKGLKAPVEAMIQAGYPLDLDNDLIGARAFMRGMEAQNIAAGEFIEGVSKEVVEVSYPDNSHTIQLYVYKPTLATVPLPVLYWTHGGGLVVGTAQLDEVMTKTFAKNFNCAIVSVEYRLAPDFPFPTPLEDVYLGLKWIAQNGKDLGIDIEKIAIGGASAGGGLTAALAQLARDRNELPSPLIYQLLMYPMLDYKNTIPLTEGEEDTYIWSKANNIFGWTSYLGHSPQEGDAPKYASALHTEDLEGLPPTMILIGGIDLFVQEDIEYAKRLNNAGVSTELHVYPGGFHGFEAAAPDIRISQQFQKDLLSGIQAAFQQS